MIRGQARLWNFAKRWCPYAKVYYKHKIKESGKTVLATNLNAIGKMWKCSAHTMNHNGTGLRVQRAQKAVNLTVYGVKDFKSHRSVNI
jgi:hypothetical protein